MLRGASQCGAQSINRSIQVFSPDFSPDVSSWPKIMLALSDLGSGPEDSRSCGSLADSGADRNVLSFAMSVKHFSARTMIRWNSWRIIAEKCHFESCQIYNLQKLSDQGQSKHIITKKPKIGLMFQALEATLAPWEVSDLDRHLLSYCVSLEVTPSQQRTCISKGKDLSLIERQRYVR